MARKAFFSFHYERDITRVSRIRNSWLGKGSSQTFLDHADWEKVRTKGKKAIQDWIDEQMPGSSVIVVCFGLETHRREWVYYEIEKAHKEGRGIIAIDLSGMKHLNTGQIDSPGRNPLLDHETNVSGRKANFSSVYPTYHWINNDGYNNMPNWIETAAKKAGY